VRCIVVVVIVVVAHRHYGVVAVLSSRLSSRNVIVVAAFIVVSVSIHPGKDKNVPAFFSASKSIFQSFRWSSSNCWCTAVCSVGLSVAH